MGPFIDITDSLHIPDAMIMHSLKGRILITWQALSLVIIESHRKKRKHPHYLRGLMSLHLRAVGKNKLNEGGRLLFSGDGVRITTSVALLPHFLAVTDDSHGERITFIDALENKRDDC